VDFQLIQYSVGFWQLACTVAYRKTGGKLVDAILPFFGHLLESVYSKTALFLKQSFDRLSNKVVFRGCMFDGKLYTEIGKSLDT